jgi:cold shock CspA family protein
MAQTALVRGQIAYVNSESDCGFIATEETEQDVLFLRSSVKGPIPEVGEDVRFELVETQDGPRAREVRRT